MKNFKPKNYSFWVSLASAVVVFLNSLSKLFGFSIQSEVVEEVILSIAGILLVFGVINLNTNSDSSENTDTNTDENLDETDENLKEDEKSKNENDSSKNESLSDENKE